MIGLLRQVIGRLRRNKCGDNSAESIESVIDATTPHATADHVTVETGPLFTMDAAKEKVSRQVQNLNLPGLEATAVNRARQASRKAYLVEGQLSGIIPLLECGETVLDFLLNACKEVEIPSAVLQPFYNAEEMMINVCFVHLASKDDLVVFIEEKHLHDNERLTRYQIISQIAKPALQTVLTDYQRMRNMAAHGCRFVSAETTRSLVQRTYESIQRMELLVHPR